MIGRVAGKNAFARAVRQLQAPRFGQIAQIPQHVVGAVGDQDFAVWAKDFVETGPPIADDRGAAGGSLEQANARRVAAADHGCAGHI